MGAQITGLLFGLSLFFYYIVKFLIPNVVGIYKLRIKKYTQNINETILTKYELNNFTKLVNYKLNVFIKQV
jgi:hypothetical protein